VVHGGGDDICAGVPVGGHGCGEIDECIRRPPSRLPRCWYRGQDISVISDWRGWLRCGLSGFFNTNLQSNSYLLAPFSGDEPLESDGRRSTAVAAAK